jgi:predicted phosphate transport protein (TIGR00153 family)
MSIFTPKQNIFFELFLGTKKDMEKLSLLFSRFANEFDYFKKYAEEAHAIERNADEKTHRIIEELNTTFITPFDREDIYTLAHELDDIIDLIEDIIRKVYLYRLEKRIEAMKPFAKLISEDTALLGGMMQMLSQMKHTPELQEAKIKIHNLEDRGDVIFEEAITKLFVEERDSIRLIKVKDILEQMEMVADKFQDVSDIIEGIVIKST